MKKIAAVAAAMMIASSVMAGTVTFYTYSFYVHTPAPGSVNVPSANNWTIGLYQDVSNNGIGAFGNADDVLLGTTTGYSSGGVTVTGAWNGSFDGLFGAQGSGVGANITLFARVYNSSDFFSDTSIGSATEYVNVGQPWYETFTADPDSIELGGTAVNGSDWQPIPEPASMALFGLGMVTLAVRRFVKK